MREQTKVPRGPEESDPGGGHRDRNAVDGQAAKTSGDTEFDWKLRKLRKRDPIKAVHELSYFIDTNSTPN